MQCIFCRETMLKDSSAEKQALHPSREHIIPSALGGTNAFSTMDVCIGCNSSLGETVDAHFISQQIVVILRQKFQLAGYSGKVPTLTMEASSVQTAKPYTIKIPHSGEVKYDTRPIVSREQLSDGNEKITVCGDRDDVAKILLGIKEKAKRRGRHLLNVDGSFVTSVEDSVASAGVETTDSFESRMAVDLTAIRYGLLKIAFGFAHIALGYDWSLSKDADKLRDAARGLLKPNAVKAMISGIRLEIRDLLLDNEQDVNERHVVALLPGQPPMIIVSLFGVEFLTLAVPLSVSDTQMENAALNSNRFLVSISPRSKDTCWLGLKGLVKRINPAVDLGSEFV